VRKFFLSLAFVVVCASGAAHRSFSADAPINVRLGTVLPQGSSYYKHLQEMGDNWRRASNGRVVLTIYPDGRMGDEPEIVKRINIGQLQAGMLSMTGLAEAEPGVSGLQNMPMMFRSLDELDYIGDRLRPTLQKRLEAKGFVVLFWTDTGWVRFFSKQSGFYPDDFRKMKLFTWAGSPKQSDLMKDAGFRPIALAASDIYSSLETGMIDAVPTAPFFALATQIDKAAPHMLELNWAPLVGALVVSKKTWDKIPPATQAALREGTREHGRKMKADGRREGEESVEAMKKRGLIVHAVTPEIEAEWRKMSEGVYPKIRGNLVPADVFDEVSKLLAEYRSQPRPSVGAK
jgi:TRAP-type C4-dicarboxylate transport system substrate-binding protein